MNVADGDTIEVDGCEATGTVRLILVDAPEASFEGECFGEEAKEYVRNALEGNVVRLERDTRDLDDQGRYLRYVWLEGEFFNERLVREGYAVLAVYPPDTRYRDRIEQAEREAREAARGRWQACLPQGQCDHGSARVVALDKRGELVTVEVHGPLGGLQLVSTRGTQEFDFPGGLVGAGPIQIVSGVPQFPDSPRRLWWIADNVWNNSEDDDAVLYCNAREVDRFDDGD
ncbi:MAG: thermonuclease family protein [Dehalococcoidia bacterium]